MASGTTGVKRKRRPAQKGVQAVFTQDSGWKGRAELGFGTGSMVSGALAWVYSSKEFGGLGLGNLLPWDPSLSAILLPLSIPFLIAGVGLCTYYLVMKRTWRARNRIEAALFEFEALVAQNSGTVAPSSAIPEISKSKIEKKSRSSIVSKALAFAVVQSIILIIMYTGLVREYSSNLNMQYWVRSNFAPGIYLLNYDAVLVLTGIVGILVFQLLPRRLGKTRIQN